MLQLAGDAAAVQDELGVVKLHEQTQRLALLEEINLVQAAAQSGKLWGSKQNVLKGGHRSASILVSYSHGRVADNVSLYCT